MVQNSPYQYPPYINRPGDSACSFVPCTNARTSPLRRSCPRTAFARRKEPVSFTVLLLFLCFPGVSTHCDCIFHSPVAGFSLLVFRGFLITHNDAPQSVGLLWTSDQSVAETSTLQFCVGFRMLCDVVHCDVGCKYSRPAALPFPVHDMHVGVLFICKTVWRCD